MKVKVRLRGKVEKEWRGVGSEVPLMKIRVN